MYKNSKQYHEILNMKHGKFTHNAEFLLPDF